MAQKYNNNKRPTNDADSLKRSHSKSSNFKLTMLCLLSALALCVAVCALAFLFAGKLDKEIVIPTLIGSGVLFVVCCTWFSSFKR